MPTIDLTPLLQALLGLLAAIITGFVVPWVKARTTATQQIVLKSTIEILVGAAEQLFGAGKGPEKLAYVDAELEKRGFKLDTAAIEAAVRELTGKN